MLSLHTDSDRVLGATTAPGSSYRAPGPAGRTKTLLHSCQTLPPKSRRLTCRDERGLQLAGA